MTEQTGNIVRRRQKQKREKRRKIRFLLLALLLLTGSGALLFHKDKLSSFAEMIRWLKQSHQEEITASTMSPIIRGDIYDRNFRPLAVTYKTYAVYARPLEMEDHISSASILSDILGLEKSKLLADLKSERGFIWIAKGLDLESAGAIKEHDLPGIYQVAESQRFYPNSSKASHVVGFVENGQGLDGTEFQYNTILRGDEITGQELDSLRFVTDTELGEHSTHLVLNLDLMLQANLENYLGKRAKITGAASGSVILMDANTGAILALASHPPFNPNRYWDFSSSALKNYALTEPVYPGDLSVIFQQAALINLHNENRKMQDDNPENVSSAIVIIPEQRKRRRLSAAPVIGDIDKVYFTQFTGLLGYGPEFATDIPLKDESPVTSSHLLNSPSFNSSALRLLNGFTTLLNGGKAVTPHLLHRAYQKESGSSFKTELASAEQKVVLNPETSEELSKFLAANWRNPKRRNRAATSPMFFESHRYVKPTRDVSTENAAEQSNELTEEIPYISQSVMLGAIPGNNPRLTMIAVLSYPDNCDPVYPDSLESLGNKFSILSPNENLIKKMLHVVKSSPPVPSPDFWDKEETMAARISESRPSEIKDHGLPAAETNKSMPDVTGKSLRAGLQILQHFNLDIKLVGSGRIVSQKPSAGTELTDVTECTLSMQQEI
jgi:cell division protein FtsI (penicillin-binding protein 3)